jgi:hypothetical protein
LIFGYLNKLQTFKKTAKTHLGTSVLVYDAVCAFRNLGHETMRIAEQGLLLLPACVRAASFHRDAIGGVSRE